MEVYIAEQTMLFLKACLVGFCLGAVYDGFRIMRIGVSLGKTAVFIEDMLFWLICSAVTVMFIMSANSGTVRGFVLVGEGLGAAVYFFTLSVPVMGCAKAIIKGVKAVLKLLYKIFIAPFVRLFKFLGKKTALAGKKMGLQRKKVENNARFALKRNRLLLYNLIYKHNSDMTDKKANMQRSERYEKKRRNKKTKNTSGA